MAKKRKPRSQKPLNPIRRSKRSIQRDLKPNERFCKETKQVFELSKTGEHFERIAGVDFNRHPDAARLRRAKKRLQEAVEAERRKPDDCAILAELVEATVALQRIAGEGSLELAAHALNRMRQLMAPARRILFCDASLLALRGSHAEAMMRFNEFIDEAGSSKRYRPYVEEAKRWMEELDSDS